MIEKNKMRYLQDLESDLKKYDKVFLVLGEEKLLTPFLTAFCDAIIAEGKEEILVLSEIHLEKENLYLSIFRKISKRKALFLCRLYHMYEFSDRFIVLSPNKIFGGIFNFFNTGLLSAEEVFKALLDCKINE